LAGPACPVDCWTILYAVWFKSVLERLGITQHCAQTGKIQAQSDISRFKTYHYRKFHMTAPPYEFARNELITRAKHAHCPGTVMFNFFVFIPTGKNDVPTFFRPFCGTTARANFTTNRISGGLNQPL
jgi:hypothetical protein